MGESGILVPLLTLQHTATVASPPASAEKLHLQIFPGYEVWRVLTDVGMDGGQGMAVAPAGMGTVLACRSHIISRPKVQQCQSGSDTVVYSLNPCALVLVVCQYQSPFGQ